MSVTKYLCKWFDREDKGYVTVEDIVDKICEFIVKSIIIIFIVMISSAILSIVGNVYYMIFDSMQATYNFFTIKNSITGLIVVLILYGIIYITIEIWEKIKEFKVIKCPLKEKKWERNL